MQSTYSFKIITACGLGTGTALYLKMVVEEILKKAGIEANVMTADSSIAPTLEADIIVTATDLAETFIKKSKAKVIVEIDNYGDKSEISRKLLEAIKKLRGES
ncbi:MAG: PTS sugar transporter subunit IIB [Brevinematia bacterium]|jgi:PTS system ascorbate-specific IIB component